MGKKERGWYTVADTKWVAWSMKAKIFDGDNV